jgi:lipopolysaccharide export system permease protein
MFPFIILLSGIWFFLKIKKTDEIIAMKVSGMSNFSVIIIPCIVAMIIGIFYITAVSPVTSFLVKKYENIKGDYEKEQDYLAAITENGIWIKEKKNNKINFIRSEFLENQNLINLSLYEFDDDYNFIARYEAESANIKTKNWVLKNVKAFDNDGHLLRVDKEAYYTSLYDIDKIRHLYSNLDTISFWNIENQIQLLEQRGYSTKEMETKLQRSFSFPFFLLAMVLLSGVVTLGIRFKENNFTYIFVSIIACVLIYFFNDFSAALGKTDKLTIELAVWMPILIIFIFGSAGIIYANQN